MIEWPEKMESVLPEERLWILMDFVAEEHRQLLLKASGSRYDAIVAEMRQHLFGGD